MSDRLLYLQAAETLRANEKQWQAYQSTGHCVVLAGPGSGKTKTLTVKLARLLSEDIQEPRGIACITYNNECARELETRLDMLGVTPGGRVFIGTVHSFSLTQILLPYAKVAGLGLPDEFAVATKSQTRSALSTAYAKVIDGPDNPQNWELRLNRHRRRHLDRNSKAWRTEDLQLTRLAEVYESELRKMGVIDFDDMPLLAVRALLENPWLQKALVAKYPILAVDEYQDLGLALHGMVMQLCFTAGMRLFAVGDVDQSIYGFTGAHPELLATLSERKDVETVQLGLNYRCGSSIVTASEYALGEARGYSTPEGTHDGTIYFHPSTGDYSAQARHLFESLIPQILTSRPQMDVGEIAILYPAAFIGDAIEEAAKDNGFSVIRTDGNALYPRSSRLLRWLEQCAIWCCSGWRLGSPGFSRVLHEAARLFSEILIGDAERLALQRDLLAVLWERRDEKLSLYDWLVALRTNIIGPRLVGSRTLAEEVLTLNTLIGRLSPAGDTEDMTLSEFAGIGSGLERINLSTLHSSKGREFDVVILFGIEEGRLPRRHPTDNDVREARRLFYVGFTRARHEVHVMYGRSNPSRFVTELERRLADQ